MIAQFSLATRLTLTVVIALLLVWLGALVVYYRAHDWESKDWQPSATRIAAIVKVVEDSSPDHRQDIFDALTSDTLSAWLAPDGAITAIDKTQKAVGANVTKAYAAALGHHTFNVTVTRPKRRQLTWLLSSAPKMFEIRVALKSGGFLIVRGDAPLAITRFGLPLGFGAGLFGTLVALAALILMNRQMRPLFRLAAAVDQMDLSRTDESLPAIRTSAPEIVALIAAFNRMRRRLTLLLNGRMAMLGGISHDVRTFATRLRLRVDRIPDREERERAINDIADMIRLLDDALLASRAGANELDVELLEFDKLVETEFEDRRLMGAEIQLGIAQDARGANVLGDRLALRRIVSNLVDNALHYGRVANLRLERNEEVLTLIIDDEGPGIPADQRDMLLEPFVRLETSRNRRTGGAGLGLAIVRSLIEAHGGNIAIDEAPKRGARLIVCLPIFDITASNGKTRRSA